MNKKQVETSNEQPKTTLAEQIWSEIKEKPINMFSLPGQTVEQHCSPVKVEPSKLYLLTRSSAVLPALETALGRGYTVDRTDKYVTVVKN